MTEHVNRCPTCGTGGPAAGRSFCEVCGDFVDWDEIARSARTPAAEAVADATPRPSPTPPSPQQPAPLTDTAAQQQRARELLVPLSEPPVAPVMPGRPEPPPPDVRPPVVPQENGIVCWNCGVGNRPDRRFCRNCGVDLAAVPAPPPPSRPSWWRRLRSWLRRNWIVLTALLVVGLLAVGAAVFVPRLLGARAQIILPPTEVAASQTDAAHPPASAFDGRSDSWWGTGRAGDSAGQFLEAGFIRPVDLTAVTITPGVSGRPEDRDRQNRPRLIDIAVTDAGGRTTVFQVELQDGVIQRIATPVDNATRITLTVRSAYIAGRDRQVAIAEVQLVGRPTHRS